MGILRHAYPAQGRATARRPRPKFGCLCAAAVCAVLAAWLLPCAVGGTPDNFNTGTNLKTSANYSAGTPGNTSDVLLTTTASPDLTLSAGQLTTESLSATNTVSYQITNTTSGSTSSTITLGNGAGFTNVNSGVANDLIYLAGSAGLYIYGPNNGGGSGTLGVVLASSGNFDVTSSQALEIGATISGNFGITKTGSGTLFLDTTNTFTGTFAATAGYVGLLANNTLGSTTAVAISGSAYVYSYNAGLTNIINDAAVVTINGTGELDLSGGSETVASLGGSSATATLNIGDYTSGNTTYSGAFTVSGGTSTTYAGVISGTRAATGAIFTKQGSGTLTLTGANTFTGGTAVSGGTLKLASTSGQALGGTTAVIVNNGGTLLFGAGNQIKAGATVTLDGTTGTATINTGGFSQNTANRLGALTLTSGGVIDFSTPAASTILAFAASNGQTWSGTLKVYDYAGSPGGGGTDELFFGTNSTGLTSTQLGEIVFYSGGAGSTLLGTGTFVGSSGEVSYLATVPEPATFLAGALLTAVTGWSVRRRRPPAFDPAATLRRANAAFF